MKYPKKLHEEALSVCQRCTSTPLYWQSSRRLLTDPRRINAREYRAREGEVGAARRASKQRRSVPLPLPLSPSLPPSVLLYATAFWQRAQRKQDESAATAGSLCFLPSPQYEGARLSPVAVTRSRGWESYVRTYICTRGTLQAAVVAYGGGGWDEKPSLPHQHLPVSPCGCIGPVGSPLW